MCGNPETGLREARKEIEKYEAATAGALHDGKTKILLFGNLRGKGKKNEDFVVKFEIMSDDEVETYLGDLIGQGVTEKKRFEEPLEKIESTAKNWARLKVGYYGKAIVANTLMKAQVTYRAQVNAVSKKKKEEFKKKMKNFVWDGKQPLVAWHKLVKPIKQGGIGLVDIECALDAQKISLLRNMTQKKGQPWVNWLGRKERRVMEKWGVTEDVYGC